MTWLPSLNFAKGMAYVVVTVISLLMFWQLGLSLWLTVFLVALCHLPWVLKCWWKPFVEKTLDWRRWVLITQLALALAFVGMARAFPSAGLLFALLLLTAFLTAVHNVAADALSSHVEEQPRRRLTRELSRKFAFVVGQGVLVMVVGNLQVIFRNDVRLSWRLVFFLVAGLFLLLFLWHARWLPRLATRPSLGGGRLSKPVGLFLFFYAFAQGMQSKVVVLFLLTPLGSGGLGLSPQEFGLVMGNLGIIGLTVGGLLGTRAVRRFGLWSCRWPMALAMLVPGATYAMLSRFQPTGLGAVSFCVACEQLAFGFGFAFYLSLLRQTSGRECGKSLMALSLMLSGMCSGLLQEAVGYGVFFILTLSLSVLTPLSTLVLQRHCPDASGKRGD